MCKVKIRPQSSPRNRFYSPDIGRFLQPDPIGFRGDRTNLYRYCGNNPVIRKDPFGLQYPTSREGHDAEGIEVFGSEVPRDYVSKEPVFVEVGFPSFGSPGGSPFGGFGPLEGIGGIRAEFVYFKNDNPKDQPPPGAPLSAPPPQNPPPPSVASSASTAGASAPNTGQVGAPNGMGGGGESWGATINRWLTNFEHWWSNNVFQGPLDNVVFNGAGNIPAGPRNLTFKTNHTASHLEGTGLQSADIEAAIAKSIQSQGGTFAPNSPFTGRVNVNGQLIEFRGYTLPNGEINIGTYYPPVP